MSEPPRITRPKLARTEPIRNWMTLLRGTAETSAGESRAPEPDNAAPSEEPARAARGGTPFGDVIARSVDLGYRVVDEYIRQGQKAAERLTGRGAPETVTSDMQDAALRVAQLASDFAGLWFEMLGGARGGDAAAAATPAPAAARPAGPEGSDGGTRARVEVASIHPVEVLLDLRPTAAGCDLAVEPLRAVDPDLPPLTDVGFSRAGDDEPVRLRLRVPAEQPVGVYNALVTDADTNRLVGTLSVRVGRA